MFVRFSVKLRSDHKERYNYKIPHNPEYVSCTQTLDTGHVFLLEFHESSKLTSYKNFLDLVSHFHIQIRLMGSCGQNGGFHGLISNTDGADYFSGRRVSKMSVISSLTVQNSKIILNLYGLIWTEKSCLPILLLGSKLSSLLNSLERQQNNEKLQAPWLSN